MAKSAKDFYAAIKAVNIDSQDGNPFEGDKYAAEGAYVFAAMLGNHINDLFQYDHLDLARSALTVVDDFLQNGDNEVLKAIDTGTFDSLKFSRSGKPLLGERSPAFVKAFIARKQSPRS